MSIEFEYNILRMKGKLDLDLTTSQQERLIQLNGLYEFRLESLQHTELIRLQRNIWHDKHIKEESFQEGYWTLLYDSRFNNFKGILMTIWLGPYLVERFYVDGHVLIITIDEEGFPYFSMVIG